MIRTVQNDFIFQNDYQKPSQKTFYLRKIFIFRQNINNLKKMSLSKNPVGSRLGKFMRINQLELLVSLYLEKEENISLKSIYRYNQSINNTQQTNTNRKKPSNNVDQTLQKKQQGILTPPRSLQYLWYRKYKG